MVTEVIPLSAKAPSPIATTGEEKNPIVSGITRLGSHALTHPVIVTWPSEVLIKVNDAVLLMDESIQRSTLAKLLSNSPSLTLKVNTSVGALLITSCDV